MKTSTINRRFWLGEGHVDTRMSEDLMAGCCPNAYQLNAKRIVSAFIFQKGSYVFTLFLPVETHKGSILIDENKPPSKK